MKSATYQIVHTITYVVCLNIIRFKMMTIVFGLTTITFCVLYYVASVLVYKFAPKHILAEGIMLFTMTKHVTSDFKT